FAKLRCAACLLWAHLDGATITNQAGFMECAGRAKRRRRFRMRKGLRDLSARSACESGVALRLPPQSKIGIGRVGTPPKRWYPQDAAGSSLNTHCGNSFRSTHSRQNTPKNLTKPDKI